VKDTRPQGVPGKARNVATDWETRSPPA
jgi:hypothetical protein